MSATVQQEQLLELALQLKKTSPAAARQILNSQPQIAYALMPLMVAMNAVNFDVFQKILAEHAAAQLQLQSMPPAPYPTGNPTNAQWSAPQSVPLPVNANVNPVLVREKMPKSNVTGWGPRAGSVPTPGPPPTQYNSGYGQQQYPQAPPYGQPAYPSYGQPPPAVPGPVIPPYRNINMNTPTSKISINASPPPGFGPTGYGTGYTLPVESRNNKNNSGGAGYNNNNKNYNNRNGNGKDRSEAIGSSGYNNNNNYNSAASYPPPASSYNAPYNPPQQSAPVPPPASEAYSLPPGVPEMLAAMDENQRNMITSVLAMTPAQIALLPPEEQSGIAQLRATLGIPPA